MPRKLLLATFNLDKVKEISRIFEGFEIVSIAEFGVKPPEEDGLTLLENALKKARSAYEATGIPSVADDTGLFVDALGGMPGVFSARFAGPGATYEDNWRKLLNLLEGVPLSRRRARFATVAVYYDGRRTLKALGEVWGFITPQPRGKGGFGYDPVFLYPPMGRTFAEMPPEVKNSVSHRGRAFRLLRHIIESIG